MALTKQQEIIAGVGLFALLGYFALRTPEKPLEAAPGHSRPEEPKPVIPVPIVKEDPTIVKKAKAFDSMRQEAVNQQVNYFTTTFNNYCMIRQQARASFQQRINELKGTDSSLFPIADFMRKDIENLIGLAREIQRNSIFFTANKSLHTRSV